jgi:hypothetical protein
LLEASARDSVLNVVLAANACAVNRKTKVHDPPGIDWKQSIEVAFPSVVSMLGVPVAGSSAGQIVNAWKPRHWRLLSAWPMTAFSLLTSSPDEPPRPSHPQRGMRTSTIASVSRLSERMVTSQFKEPWT